MLLVNIQAFGVKLFPRQNSIRVTYLAKHLWATLQRGVLFFCLVLQGGE